METDEPVINYEYNNSLLGRETSNNTNSSNNHLGAAMTEAAQRRDAIVSAISWPMIH
jgi:hypothetical protein